MRLVHLPRTEDSNRTKEGIENLHLHRRQVREEFRSKSLASAGERESKKTMMAWVPS
jgi:hypothetical protein